MRTFIRFLLFLLVAFAASCSSDPQVSHDDSGQSSTSLGTAADHSMTLMLPFPAGEERVLTRAYQTPPTHLRHGQGEWDDGYALDFAGAGCGASWGTPVLAAAAGVVADYPLPGSSAVRSRLDASYGPNQVFIDHGNGCYSHYGHMASRTVSVGQRVQQGEQIGMVGNLGNVESSCHRDPKTDGAHVHFKLFCGDSAIVPEPISGYSGLGSATGARLSHHALHHAVGTLVKGASTPEIYLACAPDKLCHIRDETVYRSYRFWQDQSREWETVVTVSDDELACHDRGLDIDKPVQLAATTCLDGASWPTFVTFDDGSTRWRRRVPFAASAPEYAILLRSWGFRVTDVLVNGRTCAISKNADALPLRDGSVIEQSSDSDFYVISDDGTAYRLYRNLMPVLYGRGWPQVIQVPDGSVPSLVRKMDASHREFTVTDATTCPNGSRVISATGATGANGGGSSTEPPTVSPVSCPAVCTVGAHSCVDAQSPAVCVADADGCTRWSAGSCNDGFACNAASGQCEAAPVATNPPVTPPVQQPDGGIVTVPTLACTATATSLRVSMRGVSSRSLVGAAGITDTELSFIAAGGNGGLSWSSTSSAQPRVTYAGGASELVLDLPLGVTRFNLWVWVASRNQAYWFDLTQWSTSGACHVADDGYGGKVLLR